MGERIKKEVRAAAARKRDGRRDENGAVGVWVIGQDSEAGDAGINGVGFRKGVIAGDEDMMDMDVDPESDSVYANHSPGNDHDVNTPSVTMTSAPHSEATPASSGPSHVLTPASSSSPHAYSAYHSSPLPPSTKASTLRSSKDPDMDRYMIMLFLDHIFPLLYPFYRPHMLVGGRGWVLHLIDECSALFHTTMCLSSYFFSSLVSSGGAVPAGSGEATCRGAAWNQLLETTGRMFEVLREELDQSQARYCEAKNAASWGAEGGSTGQAKPPVAMPCDKTSIRMMASIVQLQRFELVAASFQNCSVHLRAAATIFKGAVSGVWPGETGREPLGDFGEMMERMNLLKSATMKEIEKGMPLFTIWTHEQAAFRFFTALLVVDDVILATASGERPLLRDYHEQLFEANSGEKGSSKAHLNLEEFVGCDNEVFLALAETLDIERWKKEEAARGSLDIIELYQRVNVVKATLESSLVKLEQQSNALHGGIWAREQQSQAAEIPYYGNSLTPQVDKITRINAARIWGFAVRIYLMVVMSGWQPANTIIRSSVEQVITLLEELPRTECRRGLSWPYAIAGCLAEPDQQHRFTELVFAQYSQSNTTNSDEKLAFTRGVDVAAGLAKFGTMMTALGIMRKVWEMRRNRTSDVRNWDLGWCLRCLGSTALLV